MIVRREKYFYKRFKKDCFSFYNDGCQKCKRTSYWLFGIIPVYIKTQVLSGDYMN